MHNPSVKSIQQIAANLGIPAHELLPFGDGKAKIREAFLREVEVRPDGKLILVTAVSPTPPGEGKTTTSIGLADGLTRIGKNPIVALRQPSMGPIFGKKGGATGGGRAQLHPTEEINMHFTGDFHAVQSANNLLAAMIDNHLHHGNALNLDSNRIFWRRTMDLNDRALRSIRVGEGGKANGPERTDGFHIVAASEVMAVLCLARDRRDLEERLGRIVIGADAAGNFVRARDLQAVGAMMALLRDAALPNLVQTLEGTPALVHGGPFANIAHGCSSLRATNLARKLGDYTITEAGFGADLGAEKFLHIKCREGRMYPDAAVVVATLRALKYHGGAALPEVMRPNADALLSGSANLKRHLENLRGQFGLPCLVALNVFQDDLPEEIEALRRAVASWGFRLVPTWHFQRGGEGAMDLAAAVVALCAEKKSEPAAVYALESSLEEKARAIAAKIYGAGSVVFSDSARATLALLQGRGFGGLPVCMAKTPYSFSADARLRGAPSGHEFFIREAYLSAGAGFVVMVSGDIMLMPGLPAKPAALQIGLSEDGRITGLS